MLPRKRTILSGWGRFPKASCITYRPEKQREIAQIYSEHPNTLITRGQGRSYGDASLNTNGVILTERLDRFLKFDTKKGVLTAQAGVTLAELLQVTVPKGWLPPVIPGTKQVSLGGCVACNVHGKNQYRTGEFAACVQQIKLRLPGGDTVLCGPETHADLFWATAGGMGMTGSIEEVALQLRPIASASVKTVTQRVENLEAMVNLFRTYAEAAEYMVGWIDHFGKAEALGRGVFEHAVHASAEEGAPLLDYTPKPPRLRVPEWFPSFLLNRYSMAVYNALRFRRYKLEEKEEIQPLESFFHPLDGLQEWNRLYGKKGFLQYQCLIPEGPEAINTLRHVLHLIQESGEFSYLAVLKYHRAHQGLLSFSDHGFSLALDFPNTSLVHLLLERVDTYLTTVGGRVYLAKDARLHPKHFQKMYAETLPKWQKIVALADPECRLHSSMASRLGFHAESEKAEKEPKETTAAQENTKEVVA
ncbi:MAG: FAD-binding oxidoreductase [Rickettsiales bacterium]|nr:FAD-binding oxidoreductase [Rickettsiales bacterium]